MIIINIKDMLIINMTIATTMDFHFRNEGASKEKKNINKN